MKKCASCTKDLPDAALHCVFCGAKQPPAPAAQPAMAKTVMGYGGNEELNRLREQAAAQNAQRAHSPSAAPTRPIDPQPAPMGGPMLPAPNAAGPSAPSAPSVPSAPSAGPPMPAPSASPALPPAAVAPTLAASGPSPYGARPHTPSQPPPVGGYAPGNLAPVAGAQAKTMFAGPAPAMSQGSPASGPASGSAMGASPMGASPMGASPLGTGPMGGGPASGPSGGYPPAYSPPASGPGGYQPQPVSAQPIPSAAPPYMAPRTAAQANRPIEPWKDTLRTQMFIWGAVLVACFAVPLSLSPLVGYWNVVLDGEGTAKLLPLILAAVGILSIVVGAIPMAPSPRGLIGAILALSGIFVPLFVVGAMPEWTALVSIAGTVILVPALLLRQEYTESALPRILVTVGALAALAPFVVPQHGSVPLVELFKGIAEMPGAMKVVFLAFAAYVVVLVLTLLAWMPAPATAGAKVLAWVLMLFPLIFQGVIIGASGGEGIDFERNLNPLVLGWAYGAGAAKGAAAIGALTLGTAYLAISSYGLASVIGKKLE